MTAASNSESRKRHTVAADPVEIVGLSVAEHVRSTIFPDYCLCGAFTKGIHTDHATFLIIAALRAEGFTL